MTIDWQFVGEGGEARVWKSFFQYSPSEKGLWIAKREVSLSETKEGKYLYEKNVMMKKLDDFFLRHGRYTVSHIPKPIGYYDKGHFYVFVEGNDSFSWGFPDFNFGKTRIKLDEWNEFVSAFSEAGFDVNEDVVRVDSCSAIGAKNIVHSDYTLQDEFDEFLNKDWKRIDIGTGSLPWDIEKTIEFMRRKGIK